MALRRCKMPDLNYSEYEVFSEISLFVSGTKVLNPVNILIILVKSIFITSLKTVVL